MAPTTPPDRPPAPGDGTILEITSSDAPEPEEVREPLFSVDGEVFTVPKVIDERIVFLAMNSMRKDGAIFSAMYLQELLLGPAQHARLIDLYGRKKITQKQFDQITTRINDLFFRHINDQETEGAEGKASPAS